MKQPQCRQGRVVAASAHHSPLSPAGQPLFPPAACPPTYPPALVRPWAALQAGSVTAYTRRSQRLGMRERRAAAACPCSRAASAGGGDMTGQGSKGPGVGVRFFRHRNVWAQKKHYGSQRSSKINSRGSWEHEGQQQQRAGPYLRRGCCC